MPPQSFTFFKVETNDTIEDLHNRMQRAQIQDVSPNGNELKTWVTDIIRTNSILKGRLHYHQEEYYPVDEGKWFTIELIKGFCFMGSNILIIFDKHRSSQSISNRLNKLLFGDVQKIFKCNFNESMVNQFVESHPHQTGLAYMRGLRIPNASGSSVYGANVENSELFSDLVYYGGRPGYIQLKLLGSNMTIGISHKGVIVFYTKHDMSTILNFIKKEILPIINNNIL